MKGIEKINVDIINQIKQNTYDCSSSRNGENEGECAIVFFK